MNEEDRKMQEEMNIMAAQMQVSKIVEDVLGEMVSVYPIHGGTLGSHRIVLGMSRQDFAKLCGWSTAFQQGIEEPRTDVRYLSCSQCDKIRLALQVAYDKKLKRDNAI